MAEYIEREAAIEKTEAFCDVFVTKWTDEKVLSWIRNLPAADVQPVVHGRWVNERMIVGGFAETWACDCSVCGETQREPLWKPNYCPNCGSKMDAEEET